MSKSVLIVDDEPDIRELLEITLSQMSLTTESADSLARAYELLDRKSFSLCLTDTRLPDGDGLTLVEHLQRNFGQMSVAVITANANTETALKVLKSGACDLLAKPVDLQKLRALVNTALKLSSAAATPRLENGLAKLTRIGGQSPASLALRTQIKRLARSQAPVYISGESGSGKELAARSIHLQSARAAGPFVAVNCGAIPAELMESELFGHLKGSFTGAENDKIGLFKSAAGGTLFLDEIADLPLHMQVKLLRVIQEKSVRPLGARIETPTDVRLLSASHKNLANELIQGRFRQDLYYRINVLELSVPSLRERREDIPDIVQQLLIKIAQDNALTELPSISESALGAMCRYNFPGNVRELENILQRALTLSDNMHISLSTLEITQAAKVLAAAVPEPANMASPVTTHTTDTFNFGAQFSLERHLESIEKQAIAQALIEARWNKTAAAQLLGMSFRSLRYRIKKFGVE